MGNSDMMSPSGSKVVVWVPSWIVNRYIFGSAW